MKTTTNIPTIPDALNVLKPLPIWCLYRSSTDKVPRDARTGRYASTTDPQTWATGDYAEQQARKYGYEGFHVMCGQSIKKDITLHSMDLDHVIDPSGDIAPEALQIIEEMNSYTEVSASGTGIHILYLSRTDPTMQQIAKKKDACGEGTALEIFNAGHFCGVTGRPYGQPRTIALCEQQARAIYERYGMPKATEVPADGEILTQMRNTPKTAQNGPIKTGYKYAAQCTDDELIEKACKNQDFAALWAGNYGEDHSAADLALCKSLAFWCNADPVRIDSLFRQSGLMRDKWNRKAGQGMKYGERTIIKAMENITPYQPARQEEKPAQEEPTAQDLKPLRDYSMQAYIASHFMADIDRFKSGRHRKTGMDCIDREIGSLWAGLYTISAAPGCGKSTFMFNVALNLARAGETVLYFSLEMTPFELVAKAISRASASKEGVGGNTLTALQVMTDRDHTKTWDAIDTMQKYADRLHIIPAEMDMNIDRIITIAEQYEKEKGITPTVVLDYLQIVQPKDIHMSDMESINYTVRRLKQYQMRHDNAVFAISSTARSNYYNSGGIDAGKGSGTLEFSANYVWTLQYAVLEDSKKMEPGEARKTLREEMEKTPRKLVLACSKARSGKSGWSVNLDFYPAINTFMQSK